MSRQTTVRPRRLLSPRDPMFRPVGIILAVLCFLAVVSLLAASWSLGQPKPISSGGAVLILHDATQAAGQYRLLRAALANAGLASQTLRLKGSETADLLDLQNELARLAQTTQSPVDRIWLAADSDSAVQAFRAAAELPELAGLLLISPGGLATIDAATAQTWPARRVLLMVTGSGPAGTGDRLVATAQAEDSRLFFESITGEDAHLFAGDQVAGIGQPVQYTSVNGEIHLAIFPAMPPDMALFSPYLLPVAARLIGERSTPPADAVTLAEQGRRTISLVFLLILAGLLLLAVPFCLGLAVSRPRDETGSTPTEPPTNADVGQKSVPVKVRPAFLLWLTEILLWLPPILLAAGLGWLAHWLTNRLAGGLAAGGSWLFFAMLILPGCRGWLILLARHVPLPWLAGAGQPADVPLPENRRRYWLAGAIVVSAFTAVVAAWLASYFGAVLPAGWPWFILPLLILANFPAGLAGSAIRANLSFGALPNGRPERLSAVWPLLPFLVLPVFAALTGGWTGLAGGIATLVVAVWAFSFGRIITAISRQSAIGSLAQAVLYSLAMLIPPIIAWLPL